MFVTSPEILQNAITQIQDDLVKQVEYFNANGSFLEAKRLHERTEFDLEMIRELGYCSGIENYSRYLDGREPGTRPFCLLDYFPMIFDGGGRKPCNHFSGSCHVWRGPKSKGKPGKLGFRLPAAMDNRPLKFEEFEALQNQVLYVSATPADYELKQTEGVCVNKSFDPLDCWILK